MPSVRELVFDILAIDRASAVFDKIAGRATLMGVGVSDAQKLVTSTILAGGAIAGLIAVEAAKTSTQMEAQMTRIGSMSHQTSAAMTTAWDAIDTMAPQVGESVTGLADAMYYVAGAGFKGQEGIDVLRIAAQGAKVDMADVKDVSVMLAGAMNDYSLHGGANATKTMNIMNAAVGESMVPLQDFAEAWTHIGAVAASANVTMPETASALAALTRNGLPAADASTFLRQAIGHLEAPSKAASKAMAGLGIDSRTLAFTLGSGTGHGLGDSIQMINDALTKKLGPAGAAAMATFKASGGSAEDFKTMMDKLPKSLQPNVASLAEISGGVKGFQGVLMLSKDGMAGYKDVLGKVNGVVAEGSDKVHGWSERQATLQQKIDDTKGAWSTFMDRLGKDESGPLKIVITDLEGFIQWCSDHTQLVEGLGLAFLGLSAAFLVISGVLKAIALVQAVLEIIGAVSIWIAVQWDLNLALMAPLIPIFLVIAAIALTVAAIVYLYVTFKDFRDGVHEVWRFIWNNIIRPNVELILKSFAGLMGALGDFVGLLADVPGAPQWIKDLRNNLKGVQGSVDSFANSIKEIPANVPVVITVSYHGSAQGLAQAQNQQSLHNATGTEHFRGGMTWVGENGPELVNLPAASKVYDTNTSRDMAQTRSGSGSGGNVNIEHYYAGSASSQEVAADFAFRLRTA